MAHRGEDLYEQHARQVFRYLFSITGEQDTAEELTQETFYQALKNLDAFRGDSTPQALAVRHRQAPVVQGTGAPEEDGSAGGGAAVYPGCL